MKKIFLFIIIALTTLSVYSQSEGDCWYGMRADSSEYELIIFNNSNKVGDCLSIGEGECYWVEIKTDDGYYYIMNNKSGLYLQPEKNLPSENSKIIQAAPNGSDIQKWIRISAGDYFNYYLPKLNENLYITVVGASVTLQPYTGLPQKSYVCFPYNTQIQTINGIIDIENIKSGMQILSYNPQIQQTEFATVKELQIHTDTTYQLTKITFINNNLLYASTNKNITLFEIEATANHPILTTKGLKKISEINKRDTILYYSEFDNKLQECTILDINRKSRTVDKVYNIKLTNDNLYIANGLIASPKCPFVYAKKNGTYQKIDEILRNQMSSKLDKYDYLDIPYEMINNGKLTVKISEEKDEISYLDHIYLQVGDKTIKPICDKDIL